MEAMFIVIDQDFTRRRIVCLLNFMWQRIFQLMELLKYY